MTVTLTNKVGAYISEGLQVNIEAFSTRIGNIYILKIEREFDVPIYWTFNETNDSDIVNLIICLEYNNSGIIYENGEYILQGPRLKNLNGNLRILEVFPYNPFTENYGIDTEEWLINRFISNENLHDIFIRYIGFYPDI